MLCKGTVQEASGKKSCWLPADHFERHGLCRRCLFYTYTEWLDGLRGDHPYLAAIQDRSFLEACLHPGRQQSLLATLTHLLRTDSHQFQIFLQRLQRLPEFPIVLSKHFDTHIGGPRCHLYQTLLKQGILNPKSICKSCWNCISLCIRNARCMETFPLFFLQVLQTLTRATYLRMPPQHLNHCLEALYLQGKDHYCRLVLDHLARILSLEEQQEFAVQLLKKEPFIQKVFTGTLIDLYPPSFLTEVFLQSLKQRIYRAQKNRQDIFKEELMARTWHPSRLFTWCFDLDELKEFDDS